MRIDYINIGDIVRDNSTGYPCIDVVVGVRYDKDGTMYKMRSSGMYVPSNNVEKFGVVND